MTKTPKSPSRLIALLCTTALLAALPLTLHVNFKTGTVDVKSAVALADNDGGSDNGSDDNGSDDNGSDDNGGSHDNGSHDNGSHDNGSHDNGNDDNGNDDNGNDDNDDNNDGFDDSTGVSVSGSTSGSGASAVSVLNLRRFANGIEVELSDGSVESIIDGTYTRRNASGAVVESHAATRGNIDRLSSL